MVILALMAGAVLVIRAAALGLGLAELPSGLPVWGAAWAELLVGSFALFTGAIGLALRRLEARRDG